MNIMWSERTKWQTSPQTSNACIDFVYVYLKIHTIHRNTVTVEKKKKNQILNNPKGQPKLFTTLQILRIVVDSPSKSFYPKTSCWKTKKTATFLTINLLHALSVHFNKQFAQLPEIINLRTMFAQSWIKIRKIYVPATYTWNVPLVLIAAVWKAHVFRYSTTRGNLSAEIANKGISHEDFRSK